MAAHRLKEKTMTDFKNIKTPVWANADATAINCQIEHPVYGWIPFTASSADTEQSGREVFAALIDGDHGPIADYTPPPPPSDEALAAQARQQRAALLSATDWTELPSVQANMTSELQSSWALYRQALRDVPLQEGFPQSVEWPIAPVTD